VRSILPRPSERRASPHTGAGVYVFVKESPGVGQSIECRRSDQMVVRVLGQVGAVFVSHQEQYGCSGIVCYPLSRAINVRGTRVFQIATDADVP
jgi:hypothetical protein